MVGRGCDVTEACESWPCSGARHREIKSGTEVQTVKRVGTVTWYFLRLRHCVPKTKAMAKRIKHWHKKSSNNFG